MERQADISLKHALSSDERIALDWKLCDNGFPVDSGSAYFVLDSAHIDWCGHAPPAENQGLLVSLIQERVRDYLAGI